MAFTGLTGQASTHTITEGDAPIIERLWEKRDPSSRFSSDSLDDLTISVSTQDRQGNTIRTQVSQYVNATLQYAIDGNGNVDGTRPLLEIEWIEAQPSGWNSQVQIRTEDANGNVETDTLTFLTKAFIPNPKDRPDEVVDYDDTKLVAGNFLTGEVLTLDFKPYFEETDLVAGFSVTVSAAIGNTPLASGNGVVKTDDFDAGAKRWKSTLTFNNTGVNNGQTFRVALTARANTGANLVTKTTEFNVTRACAFDTYAEMIAATTPLYPQGLVPKSRWLDEKRILPAGAELTFRVWQYDYSGVDGVTGVEISSYADQGNIVFSQPVLVNPHLGGSHGTRTPVLVNLSASNIPSPYMRVGTQEAGEAYIRIASETGPENQLIFEEEIKILVTDIYGITYEGLTTQPFCPPLSLAELTDIPDARKLAFDTYIDGLVDPAPVGTTADYECLFEDDGYILDVSVEGFQVFMSYVSTDSYGNNVLKLLDEDSGDLYERVTSPLNVEETLAWPSQTAGSG